MSIISQRAHHQPSTPHSRLSPNIGASLQKWGRAAACAGGVLVVIASMSGCDSMTPRQQHTAIGAAAGGVGGGLLTGGSALGVVGGAAVGGVIGNSVR